MGVHRQIHMNSQLRPVYPLNPCSQELTRPQITAPPCLKAFKNKTADWRGGTTGAGISLSNKEGEGEPAPNAWGGGIQTPPPLIGEVGWSISGLIESMINI